MMKEPVQDSVYTLRVTLLEVKPACWREVEVLGAATLEQLHRIVQAVMPWTNSHLHEFRKTPRGRTRAGMEPAEEQRWADVRAELEGSADEKKARVGDVVSKQGDVLYYLYDFGDDWVHEIAVTQVAALKGQRTRYPRCTGGAGMCPPDDVGGVMGWEHLQEVLKNPRHEEYRDMCEWLGMSDDEYLDPGYFSRREAHGRLAALRGRAKAGGKAKGTPQYSLMLNPHAQVRLSTCPTCNKATYPRKFALLVVVETHGPFVQGKTCKFCSKCQMVMVQQDELEGELGRAMAKVAPLAAGKKYEILGVVNMKVFKAAMAGGVEVGKVGGPAPTLEQTVLFTRQFGLALQPGGWYREGAEPKALPATRPQRVPRAAEGPPGGGN